MAWAICGLLVVNDEVLAERPTPALELVRVGLQAFFERQTPTGMWPRGDPLFHYPSAGNAYSYVFEALAELVRLAVGTTSRATELRQLLRPYADKLVQSFRYALETARSLEPGKPLRGWSSGHHPHRTSPESWATASVYRFFQGLRRLVGIWTREEAANALGARAPTEDLQTLKERGETWNAGHGPAGLRLTTLFTHPQLAHQQLIDIEDPDLPAIDDRSARSAILYGPPGTGKTTLVEAVAGALGWRFVEISPARFLDRGVEMVSGRADEIFNMLMELDHHVVLLDEIDQLIRVRSGQADPLERFFTTTMLPRLTKLWKQGRILFFINTNSILDVDPAVQRSQRFDAALFVLPPSGPKKLEFLTEQGIAPQIDLNVVEKLVGGPREEVAEAQRSLGWFAFLRYDQLPRLAARLKQTSPVTQEATMEVLEALGAELGQSDWHVEGGEKPALTAVLDQYDQLASFQRRDFSRVRVVRVAADVGPPPNDSLSIDGGWWEVTTDEEDLEQWASSHGLRIDVDGCVYHA